MEAGRCSPRLAHADLRMAGLELCAPRKCRSGEKKGPPIVVGGPRMLELELPQKGKLVSLVVTRTGLVFADGLHEG
jgi:hypothetical protein